MIPPDLAPWVALAVVAAMLLGFAAERFEPMTVAVAAVAALLALGLLETGDVVGAFASPAVVAIGALFIISGALVRTGALDRLSAGVVAGAGRAPGRTLAAMAALTVVASAFLNNTPVVMVMIPVVIAFARAGQQAASRLLIPLSYLAILGGGCTLIGTSTNLLVSEVATRSGLDPFSIFEITSVGLLVMAAGAAFLALGGTRLLPERPTLAEMTREHAPKFLTQVLVPETSPLCGVPLAEAKVLERSGGRVIDVIRNEESLRRELDTLTLAPGDRVVLRTSAQEVLDLREDGLPVGDALSRVASTDSETMEVLVTPSSSVMGRTIQNLRLRRRHGIYPLAVHRRGRAIAPRLDAVRLQVGDTMLLEGPRAAVLRLCEEAGLVDLSRGERALPFRRALAPLAIAVMAAVVALAGTGLMPIAGAALLGVAVVLLARVMSAEEALATLDGRLLVLIVAMLAVGAALEKSGAVARIAEALAAWLEGRPGWVAIAAVFALTAVLTEAVTNNAVAVVVTPIAASLGAAVGVDPRALVVAVMVGANSSFATPISYQTNMLVQGPGGYAFADYLRIGLPMKLVTGAAAVAAISWLWT